MKEHKLEAIQKALVFIATRLNTLNIKWLLGGSGALMVHGIEITPYDFDILTTPEDARLITKVFELFIRNSNEDILKFRIQGVNVEIIKLNNLGSPQSVLFQNVPIPVNTLEDELFYYKQRPGKEDVVKLIEEKLSKHL